MAMKKSLSWLIMGLLVMSLSLAACASHKNMEGTKVKCPACGYEFEIPPAGGG